MRNNEIDYLRSVREFHRRHIQPHMGKPKGCWWFQIRMLEKSFGFELPVAYKQYLAWMGRDYNGIFVGCDWFASNVWDNTEYVPHLLAMNKVTFKLPKNYLCFFSHQGYMAAWFELPKINEDPPSWFYHDEMGSDPPRVAGRFTEVLLGDMRGLTGIS